MVAHLLNAPHLADKREEMPKNLVTMRPHHCRPAANKRSEKRLLCSDLVRIRWVDGQSVRREEIVVLEGYSDSGASVLTGIPIGAGTPVTLCGREEEYRATVRHCGQAQNGYLVGLNFGDQPRNYVPEHLLDVLLLSYSAEP
jgi:hypothetical protein